MRTPWAKPTDSEEVDLLMVVEASQKTGNEQWNIPRILSWSFGRGAIVARFECVGPLFFFGSLGFLSLQLLRAPD